MQAMTTSAESGWPGPESTVTGPDSAAPRVVLGEDDVLLRKGLEAVRVIRRELPRTAILVLSACTVVEHALDLLASGSGTGCLPQRRRRSGSLRDAE
jgi:hypothetical protein